MSIPQRGPVCVSMPELAFEDIVSSYLISRISSELIKFWDSSAHNSLSLYDFPIVTFTTEFPLEVGFSERTVNYVVPMILIAYCSVSYPET